MKVEAFAWLCMSARYKAKPFLQGLKLETFTKFVDFILGDRAANPRLPSSTGKDQYPTRPPWAVVLAFEHKLRAKAMRLAVDDGETIASAMEKVTKDPSLKETYFTTPLALRSRATQQVQKRRGKDERGFTPATCTLQERQGTRQGKAVPGPFWAQVGIHDARWQADLLRLQCIGLQG